MVPPKPEPVAAAPRARRIAVPIDVRIILSDGRRVAGHSRDISTSGLFVLLDEELVVGTEYALELMLPSAEPFMEDVHKARGRTVRRAEGGYGIELVDPAPEMVSVLATMD